MFKTFFFITHFKMEKKSKLLFNNLTKNKHSFQSITTSEKRTRFILELFSSSKKIYKVRYLCQN